MSKCIKYDIAVDCAVIQALTIRNFFSGEAGPGYLRIVAVMEPADKHVCEQCEPWLDLIKINQHILRDILALSTPS